MSEWIAGRYNTETRQCGIFGLSVHWDATRSLGSDLPPYVASIAGHRLKARFERSEEAKAAAERALEQQLRRALADLTGSTTKGAAAEAPVTPTQEGTL